MTTDPKHYSSLPEEAGLNAESLTVVVVAGADRAAVAAVLGLDLDRPLADGEEVVEEEWSAYGLVDVAGGVLAVETTGYADPINQALGRLSALGGSAAVVHSNIQAHVRFGCARDGAIVFDGDEYAYTEDPDGVPTELRDLFVLAWDELEGNPVESDLADPRLVGLAMVETFTGVRLTVADLAGLSSGPSYRARSLVYPD